MTYDGGQTNEPTSYALRPPHLPPPPSVPPTRHMVAPEHAAAVTGRSDDGAAVPEPGAGRLLGGRYRLVGRLGAGGMGTVWRARDEVVDRDVAVKEPSAPDHLGAREREIVHIRMQREARAAARIEHPSVVTVHDVVIEDAKPWIVMELVRGQSLADLLQEGTLDPREASRIGLAVLGALAAAHGAGVLHRDVKPANVLLGRDGRVVLTDFGIAQVEGEQGLTETGAFVGSPEYIAPERVLGRRPGPESDLWSLGVVLYAAVEGVSPYRRSNTPATLQAVLSAEPQMPSRGMGTFGTLVMRLLRKDPAARPSVAEIRQTLESLAAPAPATAAATRVYGGGPADGGSRWMPPVLHRNRRAQFGLGGGLLALVLVIGLVLADPFAGDTLPAGWQSRPENEVLQADVTVPKEYKRNEEKDEGLVWFGDPSGVFAIDFWHRARTGSDESGSSETDSSESGLAADPVALKKYYEQGGADTTEMRDASVSHKKITHDGLTGFEMTVDYLAYTDTGENALRHRFHELWIPEPTGKAAPGPTEKAAYWHVRVEMPAAGQAAKDGEEIFEQVTEGLKIHSS
ncbi:serine/threonine protein kinase [Streptomyces sp. NBC_00876]|uniref:serine/threonine-protein kinase n=1 Tax=Streptomyces sp. NBC_00876 TaxID=2975853 RepID=UPI0038664A82|nr:serine/threonine protein kinase [Streptomyces sp. NBC_00876]